MSKTILSLIGMVCLLHACKDMHGIYEEYTVPGGSVYPARVQSLIANSGHNRVMLQWAKSVDPSVEKVKIYWNNFRDSIEMDLSASTGAQFQQAIPLPEGTYEFVMYNLDKNMNRSVEIRTQGRSYGSEYESYLNNAIVVSDKIVENQGLSIDWGSADYVNGMAGTKVFYKNLEGKDVVKFVPAETTHSLIDDFDPFSSGYSYQAVFLPDTLSVDTFSVALDVRTPSVMLDRSLWTATASSYEATAQLPNGPPDRTIDGNLNTFWHSRHTGATPHPNYPHWLAYDMKKTVEIEKIELTSRQDGFINADFKQFIIESSDDGVEWSGHGEFVFEDRMTTQTYIPTSAFRGRYLRIYQTVRGNNQYSHLAEVVVYGKAVAN